MSQAAFGNATTPGRVGHVGNLGNVKLKSGKSSDFGGKNEGDFHVTTVGRGRHIHLLFCLSEIF